ncbi:MAG: peptidyl-prolyl cis-trans isomerase [Gemmatimonadaceae bacterium]|nr:peptidyl-prolyl cis-trans isomerase [Gemmatimonadaceae bacterium]
MKKALAVLFSASAVVAACGNGGGNPNEVAKVGSATLTPARLADLVGKSQLPLDKETLRAVAELWTDYHQMGLAAARNDSLSDNATIDGAMWNGIAQLRARKLYEQVSKTWDTTSKQSNEARYAAGEVLAARHILVAVAQTDSPEKKDGLRVKAERLRAQVTPANFAEIASRESDDPGSKPRGGDLGIFQKGQMVPDFEKALLTLKPGEISPVIATQFGFHIIYRSPFADVAGQYPAVATQRNRQVAESTYLAGLEKAKNVKMDANAALSAKAVARNMMGSMDDARTLATYTGGSLTAGRFAMWMASFPPQAQVRPQILQAPDSIVNRFVQQVLRNELVLKAADSANIQLDTAEVANMRMAYRAAITNIWQGLNIDPKALSDSATTPEAREQLAAKRIEGYVEKLLNNQVGFVDMANPVQIALHKKYGFAISDAALDKALESAKGIRAAADSAKLKGAPPTAIPVPGSAPDGSTPPAPMPTPAPAPATPPKP